MIAAAVKLLLKEFFSSAGTTEFNDNSHASYSSNARMDQNTFIPEKIIKDLEDQLNNEDISAYMLAEGKKRYGEENTFNLLYRRSRYELLKETVDMVNEAKAQFEMKLRNAASFFFSNISDVLVMDKMCKDVDDTVGSGKKFNPVVKRSSAGTLKLNCPLNDCSTSTFKLTKHLLTQHGNIKADKVTVAVEMARKMEINKLASGKCYIEENALETIEAKKQRPLSKHLHELSKSTNEHQMKQFVPIPKKCIPTEGKNAIEFHDEVRRTHGNETDVAHSSMANGKKYRKEISEVKFSTHKTDDDEKKALLKDKATTAENVKKFRRYMIRNKSGRAKVWKEAFEAHLELKDKYNPKRGAGMAINVILRYEETNGPITFQDLSNTKHLRNIVQGFKNSPDMKATSKIKYLKMFSNLLRYLFTDCDSPEKTEEGDLSKKTLDSVTFQEAENEVDNAVASLSLETNKEKLQPSNKDIKIMSDAIRLNLLKTLAEDPENRSLYSFKEILAVRNSLMAIAFLNLGLRCMEMTAMTLDDVKEAKKALLENGEEYYIVQISEQKSLKNGNKAAVFFKTDEFEVLNIFVKEMRKKICCNDSLQFVFSSYHEEEGQMSTNLMWTFLNEFKSLPNVKLANQFAKKSKITETRTVSLTGKKDTRAFAVTGDRYCPLYSLADLTNASLYEKSMYNSKVNVSLAGPSTTLLTSRSNKEEHVSMSRGEIKSVKREVHFEEESNSSDLNNLNLALMNLRAKKLKLGDKEAD